MNILLEENLPYRLLALLVLVVFYGIYFVKMLVQKLHGIQTRQIGRRKEVGIHIVEILMSIATLGIVPAQILSIAMDWNYLPANVRFNGFCVSMMGNLFFLISVTCMKDSWRAVLGFDMMYLGMLLMYCNLLTAFFTAFAVVMLHLQILQEEKYLLDVFGAEYQEYRKHVFRYLGCR